MIGSLWPGSSSFEVKKNFSIAPNEVVSDTNNAYSELGTKRVL